MAFTFTDLLHLAMPARGDKNWDADVNRALRTIDTALGDLGARPRYFDKRVVNPGAATAAGRNVSITGIEAVVGQSKTTLDGGAAIVPANTTRKPRMDALSIDPAAPGTLVLTQGDPAEILDMFRVKKVFDKNNTNLGDLIPEGGLSPIIGLFEDPVNDRLVAMVISGHIGAQIPTMNLYEFDPETGRFTNLNVTFRVSPAFQQDVGALIMVLPLGCIVPNDAGTDIGYLFAALLDAHDSQMSICLCEFDSTGLLINAFGFANADGNFLPALPFNIRCTGRGASGERRLEAHLLPMWGKLKTAKPFMADVEITSPPAALKMMGEDVVFGAVTVKAAAVDIGSVKCLDDRGNLLLMPGGGSSDAGYLIGGVFEWSGELHRIMAAIQGRPPENSVQGGGEQGGNRLNFLPLLPEILKNTCMWDWNAVPVSPLFTSPVTLTNTEQLAMSAPVNRAHIYLSNVQSASAWLIINSSGVGSGVKAPPVGKSIIVHLKTGNGLDCYWENTLVDFGGGEIGVMLDDAHVFEGAPPPDYNRLSWDFYATEVRIGFRTNNSNDYEERAFNLTGAHDNDIGKPVRCMYDDGVQRFEFISYICAAGEKRKVYAGTDNLGDDWLGPIYREANRGDIHIGWNVLDSDNVESWPKSSILTPLVRQQDTDFITLLQHNGNPSSVDQVTYSKDGATGAWLDPNAGTNGETYRIEDTSLVLSTGLPQKPGGGTDYGSLDPRCFSCALSVEKPMLTIDVLTDPSNLTVTLLPYNAPLIKKTRLDAPSIIGITAGVTCFDGRYYAAGLTFAGFPAGVIMEFSPFAKPVAPDVPANHIKVGEVLVLPDAEAPDILPENVRVEPDWSDATASRADQFLSFMIASYLNSDFRNITNIAVNFLPALANMR